MSLELHSAEITAIGALWTAWEGSSDTEIEAAFKSLDYTTFLNVIKYLRSIGLVEEPQETKLNIMLANGLRFTLMGDAPIRAYCRDNTLSGKAFHVIKKTKKIATRDGLADVDLNEYDVRIKIRREQLLDMTNHQVVDALKKWSTLPKSFRYIKRFQFKSAAHAGIVFDASLVRESKKNTAGTYITSVNFAGANLMKQPMHYEVEVEASHGASKTSLLIGITTVLRGIQKSYMLVRNSIKNAVKEQLAAQTGQRNSFPGPQPITLKRENMVVEQAADSPNIRYGDYNVTDKADGDRCFLMVARDGKMYMIDRNLNVYNTGRRLGDAATAEWSGAILDGEWVKKDAEGKPISRYYAFDILYGRRGEDVCGRPFFMRPVAGEEPVATRHAELTLATNALDKATLIIDEKKQRVPDHHKLSIHMKDFRTPKEEGNPLGIFEEAAAILNHYARKDVEHPYEIDGLIFTPNKSPLPKSGGKWVQQLKWKPASQNSIDFLVVTEKERGADGRPSPTELIDIKLREDTDQMVRVKTLRLFVADTMHKALENPRDTVLNEKPYPKLSELKSNFRPVEFSPSPPDPMGAVCYVAINAGATDAAGAAPEAQTVDSFDDTIFCESGDPINDRTIVEMVYNPRNPAGWRWTPMRVRWDKTERFSRGEILGTMNGQNNANDIWVSIHDPVTEKMITTGAVTDDSIIEAAASVSAVAYYQRRAPQRDLMKVEGLANFHNQFVKQLLISRALQKKGSSLLDTSVGQAGDLHRWVDMSPSWVLGCDIAEAGLTENKNGAYRRYLDKLIRSRGTIPPMLFVQADSAKNYADGTAGQTPLDRTILRALWGDVDAETPPAVKRLAGYGGRGFDAASCMFAIHYFFKDSATLDGFLGNIARTVKMNGLFVGCCFDGDSVAALLKDQPVGGVERGVDGGADLWTITKQYEDGTGVVPPTDEGLGRAIDVNFISIGEAYKEYLVSFPYLEQRMKAIGFELLTEEEQGEMGLYSSTDLFGETHKMAASNGRNYPMLPIVQKFSFLNRWFIFKRRRLIGLDAELGPTGLPAAKAPGAAAVAEAVSAAKAAEEEAAESVVEEVSPRTEATDEEADSASPETAESEPELSVADGPIYLFSHRSASAKKAELKELGIKNKDWRRYLSTYTPFAFTDRMDRSITYPSLEAALASAKLQVASSKPALGPQLFDINGKIHQAIIAEEKALGDGITNDQRMEIAAKEAKEIRAAMKSSALKAVGIKKIVEEAWAEQREEIIVDYVRQRFEGDVQFKEILAALAAKKARLVFNSASSGELAGNVSEEEITGDNLYGRALMRAVGLTY
jgi:hypothetical protein